MSLVFFPLFVFCLSGVLTCKWGGGFFLNLCVDARYSFGFLFLYVHDFFIHWLGIAIVGLIWCSK